MISLSELDNIVNNEEQQEQQSSSLVQKAVAFAAKKDETTFSPEITRLIDNMQAMKEREAVRRRLASFAYACGGNIHAGGGGIHIDPSKRGTFTAAASRHGMGVQAFASKVLAHKENYSPAMVKKANFARNAAKFHHAYGGNLYGVGGDTRYAEDTVNGIMENFNEEVGPTPSYDNLTYSTEWADAHGYYPNSRGHRDDRVKKPAHPTYPGRGEFVGNEFHFTEAGLNDVNRTLWGLVDNGDGRTVPVYRNTFVLPEITVEPSGSYIQNTYDNIKYFSKGGYIEDGLRSLGVTGFRVTSGYRGPNSKVGHAGKRSGHARTLEDGSSGAIDIVPTNKSAAGWAALERQLRQPQIQQFLAGFGGTILDERDPVTMKKTGATGPHFHVGLGVRGGGNFYGNKGTAPVSALYSGQTQRIVSGTGYGLPIEMTSKSSGTFNPWWKSSNSSDDNSEADFMNKQYLAASGVGTHSTLPRLVDYVYNSNTHASYPNLF